MKRYEAMSICGAVVVLAILGVAGLAEANHDVPMILWLRLASSTPEAPVWDQRISTYDGLAACQRAVGLALTGRSLQGGKLINKYSEATCLPAGTLPRGKTVAREKAEEEEWQKQQFEQQMKEWRKADLKEVDARVKEQEARAQEEKRARRAEEEKKAQEAKVFVLWMYIVTPIYPSGAWVPTTPYSTDTHFSDLALCKARAQGILSDTGKAVWAKLLEGEVRETTCLLDGTNPPGPIGSGTWQEQTKQTIGISYDQVMEYLSNSFLMERQSPLNNGQDRYMGKTKDGTAVLEIIGDKNNISQASLIVEFPNDVLDPRMTNMLMILRLLKNTVPEHYNIEWVTTALGKVIKPPYDSEIIVKGSKAIEMVPMKTVGILVVTVKHK